MTAVVTAADLRRIDLFDDTSDEDPPTRVAATAARSFEAGEVLAEQGLPAPGVQLLLEGSVRITLVVAGKEEPVGRQVAPTGMGAIAVLTDAALGVMVPAEVPCRAGVIEADDFVRLTLSHPECTGGSCARPVP